MKELWYCEECESNCMLIIDDCENPPVNCPYDNGGATWEKHIPEDDIKTQLLNKANEGEK